MLPEHNPLPVPSTEKRRYRKPTLPVTILALGLSACAPSKSDVFADPVFISAIEHGQLDQIPFKTKLAKITEIFGLENRPQNLFYKYRSLDEQEQNPEMQKASGPNRFSTSSIEGMVPAYGIFKERLTLNPDDVEQIVQTYPAHWVQGLEVEQINADCPNGYEIMGYGVDKKPPAVQDNRKILFCDESRNYDLNDKLEIFLSHEITHSDDWRKLGSSQEQSANLILSIVDRVISPDRMRFRYVEGIYNPNIQIQLELKALEYFAKLGELYFKNPDELNPKDFKIFDAHVHASDPDYDNKTMSAKRDALIERFLHKSNHPQATQVAVQ